MQKETYNRKGHHENPQCFPRDNSGCRFRTSIFLDLLNGEKVKRDWLVWSSSAPGPFSFASCLFQNLSQHEQFQNLAKVKYICEKCLIFRCSHAVVIMKILNLTNQCSLSITARDILRAVRMTTNQPRTANGKP